MRGRKGTPKRAEDVACGLIKALQGALKDPKQLYRYHVTERTDKGQETVERIYEKLDTKAAKEMTAMLRELMELLGIEEKKEAKEENAGGVIMLPGDKEGGEKDGSI